jgi:antitoxin component of MazEF toxin-antitoxin module
MVVTKKPKKDEVVTLEGLVNDITPTLIRVDTHNIDVLSDTITRMRELNLSLGDTVKITYKNGILLTIDLVSKTSKVHIDKTEHTANASSPKLTTSESSPEANVSMLSEGAKSDIHIQNCKFCGGQMRWIITIGDYWIESKQTREPTSLTQCISCKMIDTDPQLE